MSTSTIEQPRKVFMGPKCKVCGGPLRRTKEKMGDGFVENLRQRIFYCSKECRAKRPEASSATKKRLKK